MTSSRDKAKTVFVALLRGINVGNAKRVSMTALRACIEELGYSDVRTLLNSGNAVFSSVQGGTEEMARRIEEKIRATLGVISRITVLTAEELSEVVTHNPLKKVADNPSRLLVGVLANPADRKKLLEISAASWEPERIALGKSRILFMWMPAGVIESKLNVAVSKAMGDAITSRNWATILKLEALAHARGDP